MPLGRAEGIGEENIKRLVSESKGNKIAIETVEKLFADDWVNLEYADERIIELHERFKSLLKKFNLDP